MKITIFHGNFLVTPE